MDTNTDKPDRLYEPGAEYVVTSDRSELPKGSHFGMLPGAVRAGELALIVFDEEHLIPGRWFPDLDGADWIIIPGYTIQVTGAVSIRVLGRTIPNEDPPKPITNLPPGECEHFFENPFPRSLDS